MIEFYPKISKLILVNQKSSRINYFTYEDKNSVFFYNNYNYKQKYVNSLYKAILNSKKFKSNNINKNGNFIV